MSEGDIDSLRRVYAALQDRDVDGLRSVLSHDAELTLPDGLPWGGTRHGPEGVENLLEIFLDHVEGTWAYADDFLDAGDRIVVLGRMSGRAKASGQAFEASFAHVWKVSQGVPSSCRAYVDTAPIVAALTGEEWDSV